MKKVLTIAGSDCSGGAGIQADIKTITAHKMYAMSVITSLTAQNTTGVYGICNVDPEFVERQIDCVFEDIRPDAVKIGMLSNSEIIKSVVSGLKKHNVRNIVVDTVMVATSGSKLLDDNAIDTLINELLPLGAVITPNIPEAMVLSGMNISDRDDMINAAEIIERKVGTAVLVKGGHLVSEATDLLCENGNVRWFSSPRINNSNTHGTGCTLSSAIACGLADELSLAKSIENAKKYLTGALGAMLDLGHGSGPLDHTYAIKL